MSRPTTGNVGPAASSRRQAFDLAVAGDVGGALKSLSDAVNATPDVRQQGWLLEQQAVYVDLVDRARAQQELTSARAKNTDVLRPLSGGVYQKLPATAGQAAAASDHLVRLYGNDPTRLRVGGRVYHVITDPELYFLPGRDPVRALYIWDGGLGIWGAVALGAAGAWIGCLRRGIQLLDFGDALAPGLVLAQAIGRWGNYFNQDYTADPPHCRGQLRSTPHTALQTPRRSASTTRPSSTNRYGTSPSP